MFKSENRRRASRYCLSVLLVLGLAIPLLAGNAAGAAAPLATDIGAPSALSGGIIAKPPPPPGAPQRRSYNYLDLDIRQALSALAQDQEVNVIMSPEVTGKISVYLNQVTLEEAIRSIALAGGLTYRKEEGSFYVYKPKLIADPQEERLQIRIFRLNFAAIDKVQEIISAIPGMRTIRLHEPSKTIIVEDTPENIAKIETLLLSWDVAPRQVLIEARIMQVALTDDMSLGVDWQKLFGDLTIGTTGFVTAGMGLTGNLVTSAIGSTGQFTAALRALQTKTQVNTLSTPKILALHGKQSRVQVGGRQGYKTNTFTPTGTTENISFLETGTILDITPYIDNAGNVLLEVKPQINSVTFDAAGVPNQKTTTVSTSMLARNGQTMFIGGLIEDTKTGTRYAVPCFGSIPGLGLLFGQQQEGIGKSELIVLITPQIIDPEKPNAEGLEKTRQMEEKLKIEPQSLPGRLLQKFP
jgi:type IV pilus assembly protein PilQ